MNNILTVEEAIKVSKNLKEQNKQIVLTGGCFDILHVGHIKLLEKAKEKGDYLFVLIESDHKIREIKGNNRPIHTQEERAYMISTIQYVDYVVCLPYLQTNAQYDELIQKLSPSTIAVTKGDTGIENKKRQARIIGANIAEVIQYIPQKSTSAVIKILEAEQ